MDLFEYQARDLFAAHRVPVLDGIVADTPEQARAAAAQLLTPGGRVVVKAQVAAGGRGKAGGVQPARSPDEAEHVAARILGMDLKGHTVRRVLVVPGVDVVREHYVSLSLDRTQGRYVALASVEGGVEIERLATERPQALARVPVDPLIGVDAAKADEIVAAAGFDPAVAPQVATVLRRLWDVYDQEDATLVEVNPLALTVDGRMLALDAKVTLDDNAAFRHPGRDALAGPAAADPLEARAAATHLNYVRLDGQVGIVGNGAGLVMSTLDVVADAGRQHGGVRPANFLDVGGGASAQVMTDGLDIILRDPQVAAVFVNVFGGITACDEVARGILAALAMLGDQAAKPLVVRLDGNAVAAGRAILAAAAHPLVTVADTMDGGADAVTALAERAARAA
ncbi:MAG: ADP-forming succinate--CoA ligase subunit beta [Micrococcales bacterium]|nr:ADP-forming succinate--CoA ligase subunit beta [Micrococcales bacterium]